uniref:olfactory receptor 11A1-like n=1 Tax=Solea senegalensis TaxID=28829 RepID=UPI001CD874AB|nr:olfactory receptor 11A1-like [Solea senegalensis]
MMIGNSTFSYFVLGGYMQVGSLRYLYFVLTAVTYMSNVVSNTCVIVVICMTRSLHEPMYMFLCSLFINELYGGVAFFPFLLLHILSDIHTVPIPFCFLQIFCLYSYVNVEFLNLAAMAYDRYVAICCPLQYHTHMTTSKVLISIFVLWLYSFAKVLATVFLNIQLTRCRNIMDEVYCKNYSVVNLACSDTTVNNIYGLFSTVITILVPLLPILFSYLKILLVCFSGSKETRQKAISTCAPQLASLLNFSFACFIHILQSRMVVSGFPEVLQIFLSLYHMIIQPILNPLMFGLQISTIRNACKNLFCHNKQHTDLM